MAPERTEQKPGRPGKLIGAVQRDAESPPVEGDLGAHVGPGLLFSSALPL